MLKRSWLIALFYLPIAALLFFLAIPFFTLLFYHVGGWRRDWVNCH